MDSGELLRKEHECINSSRRAIVKAEAILDQMSYLNSHEEMKGYIWKFLPLLWKAKRELRKARRYERKYEKLVKENDNG